MEKNSRNIEKFIKQNMEIEKPSLEFTEKVMDQVLASESKKEKALASLIQKHTLNKPSLDFTSKVMISLPQNSPAFVYQPVIGKKAWYLILFSLLLIGVYVFFSADSTPTQTNIINAYITKFGSLFSFKMPYIFTSPLFALSIFALSSLLLLDYFIRNRRFS